LVLAVAGSMGDAAHRRRLARHRPRAAPGTHQYRCI